MWYSKSGGGLATAPKMDSVIFQDIVIWCPKHIQVINVRPISCFVSASTIMFRNGDIVPNRSHLTQSHFHKVVPQNTDHLLQLGVLEIFEHISENGEN